MYHRKKIDTKARAAIGDACALCAGRVTIRLCDRLAPFCGLDFVFEKDRGNK
jgi:hypothetical protein